MWKIGEDRGRELAKGIEQSALRRQ